MLSRSRIAPVSTVTRIMKTITRISSPPFEGFGLKPPLPLGIKQTNYKSYAAKFQAIFILSARVEKFFHEFAAFFLHNARSHFELMIERGIVHDVEK